MISENVTDINPIKNNQVHLDLGTIEKYDTTGPRYTSYPTAVEFREGIDDDDFGFVSLFRQFPWVMSLLSFRQRDEGFECNRILRNRILTSVIDRC